MLQRTKRKTHQQQHQGTAQKISYFKTRDSCCFCCCWFFFVIHRVFRVSCLFTPIPWIGLIVLFLLLVLFLSSRNKVVSFFFQKIVSLNIFFSCFSSLLPGNAEFFVYRHLCSAHTIHTYRMYFCNVAVCYVFISFWNCSVDNRFISYTK